MQRPLIGIIMTAAIILFSINSGLTQEAVKQPIVKITALNEYGQEDDGTGVILGQEDDATLYIATAAHVIPTPDQIKVRFYESETVKAEVVRINSPLDLAVIKCRPPAGFTAPASFAITKEGEKQLQSVIVIGHPLGNDWDINFNTNVKATEFDLDDRLFTLAPIGITPGNSGGPVLNQQYELLGLVQNVDQVKAVCIDLGTLLKACQAWEVPTNLLTGITLERQSAEAGSEDFRYQLFLQEANTAFADRKWKQAQRAYQQAYVLLESEAVKSKLEQCQLEINRDDAYQKAKSKGKKAKDLHKSLAFFEEARQVRDTEEIRDMIRQVRERLVQLDAKQRSSSGGKLPARFTDPLAGEFVLVKGGIFEMGDWEIAPPVHKVSLSDYYMCVQELTHEQLCPFYESQAYRDWVSENASERKPWNPITKRIGANAYVCVIPEKRLKEPATGLSIEFINAYLQWLKEKTGYTFRLPTEAEWEYAAMGGHKATPTIYAGSNDLMEVVNTGSSHNLVKTKLPNELGIYDMSGNRPEFCSDLHDDYHQNWMHHGKVRGYSYYEECSQQGIVVNPKGPQSLKTYAGIYHTGAAVVRGGEVRAKNCRIRARSKSAFWSEVNVEGYNTFTAYRLVREAYK